MDNQAIILYNISLVEAPPVLSAINTTVIPSIHEESSVIFKSNKSKY